MTRAIEPASFDAADSDAPALRRLVAKIAGLGYSEMLVRERLGLGDIAGLQWRALPIYRAERLADRDPLALAIDLFLLQGALPASEIERLFTAPEQDVLVRAGLLEIGETGLGRARASLFPVGNRLIFSDPAWPELLPGQAEVPYGQVMFIGDDSHNLARLTRRRRIRSALDLCTGSGIQALLAAAHSERVLAVDINPRAVRCARFNAQISGVVNLDATAGDLYEPTHGERFDLITANPPFVSSPLNTLGFRDGGRSGEDIQKRIVAGLPRHLAPGGVAQMITELGEREGEPIVHRLRLWLDGAPLDIHVLRLYERSAASYAIGHAKGDSFSEFLGSVEAWAGNLREQSYVRVVSLLASFQWSDPAWGPPWERVDESPPPSRAAGEEIEAIFLAERLTRKPGWFEILKQSRLRRAGPVALAEARVLGSRISARAKATLLGQGLAIEYELDPWEREVLTRLEGSAGVSELIGMSPESRAGEANILAAVASLLRKRLVSIDLQNAP